MVDTIGVWGVDELTIIIKFESMEMIKNSLKCFFGGIGGADELVRLVSLELILLNIPRGQATAEML